MPTYDLHFLRPRHSLPSLQGFVLPDGSELCTGIEKLSQRFLIELLTDVGSIPLQPTRGTKLLAEFRAGRIRTELDVITTFNFAAAAAVSRLQLIESIRDPADERIAQARLDRVVLRRQVAELHITITSRAGAQRSLPLPITTLARA